VVVVVGCGLTSHDGSGCSEALPLSSTHLRPSTSLEHSPTFISPPRMSVHVSFDVVVVLLVVVVVVSPVLVVLDEVVVELDDVVDEVDVVVVVVTGAQQPVGVEHHQAGPYTSVHCLLVSQFLPSFAQLPDLTGHIQQGPYAMMQSLSLWQKSPIEVVVVLVVGVVVVPPVVVVVPPVVVVVEVVVVVVTGAQQPGETHFQFGPYVSVHVSSLSQFLSPLLHFPPLTGHIQQGPYASMQSLSLWQKSPIVVVVVLVVEVVVVLEGLVVVVVPGSVVVPPSGLRQHLLAQQPYVHCQSSFHE